MRRFVFLTAAMFVFGHVAPADAQLPGAGGSRINIGRSPGRDDPAMRQIGPELELRLANGVNIIIAHAKDLGLTSEQLSRVVVIKRRLDSLNSEPMRQLDSLQRAHRQREGVRRSRGDQPDESDPAIERTVTILRSSVHAAEENAYEVLSGTQLQQALQLIKEARTNAALTTGRDKAPE